MKKIAFFSRLAAAYTNRTAPEELRTFARGSWNVLVISTIALLIFSAGFGFWKISSVSGAIAQAQNQTEASALITINQAALNTASQALQGRTNAFDMLATNPATTTISDPSQ